MYQVMVENLGFIKNHILDITTNQMPSMFTLFSFMIFIFHEDFKFKTNFIIAVSDQIIPLIAWNSFG